MKTARVKTMVAGSFACAFAAAAHAASLYVNADFGDDDRYDGKSPTVVSETIGPKGTLMGALSLAKDGDTVYAAAGVYSNGVYEANGLRYRAHVSGGITLVGEGPDKTFIVGAKDPTGDGYGCGPNAVACVWLEYTAATGKGGIIKGFSVSGGRSSKTGEGSGAGGIHGDSWYNLAVDCVISNNYNIYRGGGVRSISCARCVFAGGNIAKDVPRSGSGYNVNYFINCVFWPGEAGVYSPGMTVCFYNCTGINNTFYSNNDRYVWCYNCIVYGSEMSHRYYNCLLSGEPATGAVADEATRTGVTFDLDENYVPKAGSIAINGATNDYYEAAISAFWNVAALDKEHDVRGLPRRMGAAIDIGACEFDWYGVYAADLATHNVTVTNATTGVAETADKKVLVPVANEIGVVWAAPTGAQSTEIDYFFTAKVTGGATLTVERGGTVLVTATAADGEKTWSFKGTGDQAIVFKVAGADGAAELSGLSNSTLIKIADAQGGVSVSGAAVGEMEIWTGQPAVTITISRNYTTKKLCTGLMVNGEFFSFTGEDADTVFTKTVAAYDPDLTVEAVYAERNTWYVDAAALNDNGDGRTPYRAKKTLQAAMEIEDLDLYDTVRVAPGVYNEGKYEVLDGDNNVTARYRVRLKDGIILEGAGAGKTFIVGESDATGTQGCGPGAMRCVKMPQGDVGSVLKAVTVCGGRSISSTATGGGINGFGSKDYVVDCVISNNAAWRGGGVNGNCRLVRCRFMGNIALNSGVTAGYNVVGCWNCDFATSQLVYTPDYRNAGFYNCTFANDPWTTSNDGFFVYLRNCIVKSSLIRAHGKYESCLVAGSTANAYSCDERTKEVTKEELALDANGIPQAGSVAIDYGSNTLYTASLPSNHWAFAQMEFDVDGRGTQRIYNGAVDVGAHERDWREVYARKLSSSSRLAVEEATPGVTNAVDGVVLTAPASSVALVWKGNVAGRGVLSAVVTGEGTLTVTVDGTVVAQGSGGVYPFALPAGTAHVGISFAGSGSARLQSFEGPVKGMSIILH